MKVIELTQGKVTVVDDDDFEILAQYRWFLSLGYAVRNKPMVNGGKRGLLKMHRIILNAPAGMEVDHINGDGLDNRRCNLRLATRAQNSVNRGCTRVNKLGVKGVVLDKRRGKYAAWIWANKKPIYLGYFVSLEEAKNAYNNAAMEHHGEFARLN